MAAFGAVEGHAPTSLNLFHRSSNRTYPSRKNVKICKCCVARGPCLSWALLATMAKAVRLRHKQSTDRPAGSISASPTSRKAPALNEGWYQRLFAMATDVIV